MIKRGRVLFRRLLLKVFVMALAFVCAQGISKPDVLTIAYSENVELFVYTKDDQVTGIDVEIFKKLLTKLELTADFVHIPWARALKLSQAGEIDGLVSIFCDHSSAQILVSSESSYETKLSVLALKSRLFNADSLQQDNPKRTINVVRGSFSGTQLSSVPKLLPIYLSEIKSQVRQLLQGHVDFALSEESWFLNEASVQGQRNQVEVVKVLSRARVCMAFSEKSFAGQEDFIENVNKELRELKHNGFISDTIEQFNHLSNADSP